MNHASAGNSARRAFRIAGRRRFRWHYGDVVLPRGFRADVIIGEHAILEIKSVERILPLHEAQVLTTLRLSFCRVGLLLNFNTLLLKDGIRRFIP